MSQEDFNTQLQQMTLDSLKELGSWVQGLKDFTVEQAPLFVREYASWYVYSNLIWFLAYAVACGVTAWVATKWARKMFETAEKGEGSMDSEFYQVMGSSCRVIGGIAAICFFFSAAGRLEETGKGVFAPRLVVIEGITSLVQTGQTQVSK